MGRSGWVGVIVGIAATVAASDARADGWPSGWMDRDLGVGYVEGFVTQAKPQSPMPLNTSDTSRRVVGLGVPVGPTTFYGAGAGLELRIGLLSYRLLELRYSASGSGPSAIESANGAPASASVGALHVLEIGTGIPLPGLQIVQPDGAWKVGFGFSWGLVATWASASASDASGTMSGGILQTDGYVRADLTACARLGNAIPSVRRSHASQAWACLAVTPIIYERDWWSGGSIGLRVQL